MGFDQRFNRITMISTSRSYEIFKERSNQTENLLLCHKIGIKLETFDKNTSNVKRKNKSAKKGGTRKKVVEFQALIIPTRIYGEKLEIEVNKKGGELKLLGGCLVTVEENIFNKKTIISSYVVPPNKRQDFPIKLDYQEYLISEIFLIFSKVPPKRPLKLFIPSVKETNRYCFLLSCTTDNIQWSPMPKFEFDSNGITFNSDKWGYYAIVEKPPFENLNITSKGGLFNTRIHPMVSLRIPKNSCPVDDTLYLQYLQNPISTIEDMADCYPYELGNILNVSSMISFGFPSIQFKRQITIKLPLPEWADEIRKNYENNHKTGDLMLLCKRQGTWESIETRINYTKNTFTFDSKVFGTFILVEPRGNREGKIRHSLSRLEYVNNIVKGVILVFLFFESKSWFIWIELVSFEKASEIRESRQEKGLIFIERFLPPKTETPGKTVNKSIRKSVQSSASDCSRIVELSDGMIFHLKLEGDVQIKDGTTNVPIISKTFQRTIDGILKKQAPVSISNLQKMSYSDSIGDNQDTDDDFLANLGKKKIDVFTELNDMHFEEPNINIKTQQSLSIIFYRTLAENYRIIEIEPRRKPRFEDDVTIKWTQKEIIRSNLATLNEIDTDNETSESIKNPDSNSKNTSISSGNSELSSSMSDFAAVNQVFQAQTPESKARIQLINEEEIEHTFSGILTITRDSLCYQFPPNQLGPEFEGQRTVNNDIKVKLLKSYLPHETQSSFQYKFYLEPEEMRDYLGIQKPSAAEIAKAKQIKAESLVNIYLKDINLTEIDTKALQKAKKSAMKHIVQKQDRVIGNSVDSATQEMSMKKSKTDVHHKVKDRLSFTEMYKEPKVLSGHSLNVLSKYVEHGLTLAVHLQMSDTVITGIGFDSLSADQTLSEVTYKVLMNWKKSIIPENRQRMVFDLMESLRIMKLDLVADIINYASQKNEELTEDLFLKPNEYLKKKPSPDNSKHQKDSKHKRKDSQSKSEIKKAKTFEND